MNPSYFQELATYEAWANGLVLEAVLAADPIPKKAKRIFSHLINAQHIWLDRLRSGASDQKVWEEHKPDEWGYLLEGNHSMLSDYVDRLSAVDLKKVLNYKSSSGKPFTSSVAEILTHLGMHGSYHRGQLIVLVKPHLPEGFSLPASDFIFFSRKESEEY